MSARPPRGHARALSRVQARVLGGSFGALAAVLCVGLVSCAANPARGPAELRAAWRSAIERGDADAAWALLSPATRRSLVEAEFVVAFQRDAAALRADAAASEATSDDAAVHAWTATTVHPGGHRLRWAKDERGRWVVTAGLPGLVDERDPVAVLRAFVAELRALPATTSLRWITPELARATRAALDERAAAIEAALSEPGMLMLSSQGERATLTYARDRQLLMTRVDGVWRISRIE